MAVFDYEVSSHNSSRELISAIDEAVSSGKLNLNDYRKHSEFLRTYRYFEGNAVVLLGIQAAPGKAAGSEEVKLHFEGLEGEILEVKQKLVKSIGGLELR